MCALREVFNAGDIRTSTNQSQTVRVLQDGGLWFWVATFDIHLHVLTIRFLPIVIVVVVATFRIRTDALKVFCPRFCAIHGLFRCCFADAAAVGGGGGGRHCCVVHTARSEHRHWTCCQPGQTDNRTDCCLCSHCSLLIVKTCSSGRGRKWRSSGRGEHDGRWHGWQRRPSAVGPGKWKTTKRWRCWRSSCQVDWHHQRHRWSTRSTSSSHRSERIRPRRVPASRG